MDNLESVNKFEIPVVKDYLTTGSLDEMCKIRALQLRALRVIKIERKPHD